MPPLSILAYEEDGQGGWYIHWRDSSNINGKTVEAYFHAIPSKVAELIEVRRQLRAPLTDMSVAELTLRADVARMAENPGRKQREALGIPPGIVPYAVRDFIDGYADHLQDCIDRYHLNVKGGAPHNVLELARQGKPIPEQFRRNPEPSGLDDFIGRRRKALQEPSL